MSTKACSIAFVALLLLSLLPFSPEADSEEISVERELEDELFSGFFVGGADDVWNQTPWQNIAVPQGFTYDSVTDYSDVGVLINNLSEESRTIGWAFVAARNILGPCVPVQRLWNPYWRDRQPKPIQHVFCLSISRNAPEP